MFVLVLAVEIAVHCQFVKFPYMLIYLLTSFFSVWAASLPASFRVHHIISNDCWYDELSQIINESNIRRKIIFISFFI